MIAAFGLVRPGREGEAFCSSNEINNNCALAMISQGAVFSARRDRN